MSKLQRRKETVMAKEEESQVEETQTQETEQDSQENSAVANYKAKLEAYQKQQVDKLRIKEEDIDDEFKSQASLYVAASFKYHNAVKILADEKQRLEEVMSEVYLEAKNGTEKTTEAHLDKLCKSHPEAAKQRKRVILAEYQVGIHQAIMRGWEHKRDMLIQVGSTLRAEMAGQVSLNKNHPNHDDIPRTKNGRVTSL